MVWKKCKIQDCNYLVTDRIRSDKWHQSSEFHIEYCCYGHYLADTKKSDSSHTAKPVLGRQKTGIKDDDSYDNDVQEKIKKKSKTELFDDVEECLHDSSPVAKSHWQFDHSMVS